MPLLALLFVPLLSLVACELDRFVEPAELLAFVDEDDEEDVEEEEEDED